MYYSTVHTYCMSCTVVHVSVHLVDDDDCNCKHVSPPHPLTPSNWEALPSIPIKEKVTAHRGSGRGRGHVTLRCCGSVRDLLPRDESEVLWEEPKQENIKVQL